MIRFKSVYEKISQSLDGLPQDKLALSEEVKEQVNLLLLISCLLKNIALIFILCADFLSHFITESSLDAYLHPNIELLWN